MGRLWEQMTADHPDLLDPAARRRTAGLAGVGARNWSGRISPWRIRAGSTRRPASSPSRSRLPARFRCAGSSTGSTWRRPVNCGWWTTRPAAPPGPDFEARALYQLKFYALMIYRLRGVVPAQLKLIYLADGLSLQYAPSETELMSFENGVAALWTAMTRALETGNFPASPSWMCQFCAHQALCPVRRHPALPGRRLEPIAPTP